MSNNLYHLAQLGGDARIVATGMVQRWPSTVITDSRRDTHDQAQRMANNCALERYWVLGGGPANVRGTYAPSKPAQDCHDWSITHLQATAAELCAAFVAILDRQLAEDLRKLSRHLAPITALAHAFDTAPLLTELGKHMAAKREPNPEYTAEGVQVAEYLRAAAIARGGRFLEREGGLTIWHWQAKD